MVKTVPLLHQEGFKVPTQSTGGHHPAGMRAGYGDMAILGIVKGRRPTRTADDQDPGAGRGPWTIGSRARRLCPAPAA
jgi:hypothetical protein